MGNYTAGTVRRILVRAAVVVLVLLGAAAAPAHAMPPHHPGCGACAHGFIHP